MKTYRIKLTTLSKMAIEHPSGWYEETIKKGKVVDGVILVYTDPIPKRKAPLRGLGDVVAMMAQPIARGIDRVAGTNIAGCGGCAQRQEILNKVVPFSSGSISLL